MHQLFDCCAYDNRWSRRHPFEKLVFGGGMLFLALLLPPPGGLAVLLAVSLTTILGAGISVSVYLRAVAIPLAFILLGILSVLFSISLDQGGLHFSLAHNGPFIAWGMVNRAMGASSALLFMALTTPAADWLQLVRAPALREICDLGLLIYRFIFAFSRTAQTLRTAQDARNGYRTLHSSTHSFGVLISRLLVRVLDRVRGMELGLAVRGYDGSMHLLPRREEISWLAVAGFLAAELLLALLILLPPRMWHAL